MGDRYKLAMTLQLDEAHVDALKALCDEQGMSQSAVMRQALRLYQMIHIRAKKGEQLAFVKDGQVVPMLRPSMVPLESSNER